MSRYLQQVLAEINEDAERNSQKAITHEKTIEAGYALADEIRAHYEAAGGQRDAIEVMAHHHYHDRVVISIWHPSASNTDKWLHAILASGINHDTTRILRDSPINGVVIFEPMENVEVTADESALRRIYDPKEPA